MSMVFTINNEAELTEERGSAFINESLANLFSIAKEELPPTAFISQTQNTELSIAIINAEKTQVEKWANNIIELAVKRSGGYLSYSVGLYLGDIKFAVKGDHSKLSREYALEYAQFALALSKLDNKNITVFSSETPSSLILKYRRMGKYEKAFKDYDELVRIGIRNGWLENQIALAASDKPDKDTEYAVKASNRALKYISDSAILWANSAYFYFDDEKPKDAHKLFQKAKEIDPDYKFSNPYIYPAAISAWTVFKDDPSLVDQSYVHQLLIQAKEDAIENDYEDGFLYLEKALIEFDKIVAQ